MLAHRPFCRIVCNISHFNFPSVLEDYGTCRNELSSSYAHLVIYANVWSVHLTMTHIVVA